MTRASVNETRVFELGDGDLMESVIPIGSGYSIASIATSIKPFDGLIDTKFFTIKNDGLYLVHDL